MPNPFPDLPPGFLCSSPGTGVYLLDNYGNPYNRRIQRKVRAAMDKDARSIDRVVRAAPEFAAGRARERSRRRWVNPAGWFASALLPNETACADTVAAFYAAISSPGNLTEALELLAPDFVYQAPSATGLLPACVADVGGRQTLKGPDTWAEAMERQADAFNGSTSALDGGLTCRATATGAVLEPRTLCVARHLCRYTLKRVRGADGAQQQLEGETLDRFWFDTQGRIARYQSDAEPSQFRYANLTLADDAADADAA